jgi:hypothetical protein
MFTRQVSHLQCHSSPKSPPKSGGNSKIADTCALFHCSSPSVAYFEQFPVYRLVMDAAEQQDGVGVELVRRESRVVTWPVRLRRADVRDLDRDLADVTLCLV